MSDAPAIAPAPNPWAPPAPSGPDPVSPNTQTAAVQPSTQPSVQPSTQPSVQPSIQPPVQPSEAQQTAERRLEQRSRRLLFANVFVVAAAVVGAFLCTRVWWIFTIPSQQMAVPSGAPGGFTMTPIKGATATLAGTASGGTLVAVLMLAAAVVSTVGAHRKSWPMTALAVAVLAPWGPGAPPQKPPTSVADPNGLSLTTAATALRSLQMVWWMVLLGLLVVVIQTFVVARSTRKVDHPDEPSALVVAVERFVASSLSRVGVRLVSDTAPTGPASAPSRPSDGPGATRSP